MASEEQTTGGFGSDFSEAFTEVVESYERLDIPIRRYVFLILVPAIGFLFVSVIAAVVIDLPMFVRAPIALLGVLIAVTAVVYPKIVDDQRKREMENMFHLLMTHMTVLSTTNIDRMEVFRKLAEEEEYGALAEEMSRIVQLVDTWNQSLGDACRRRAKAVPSDAMSDFLDRLAYTLGAGQQLSDFLLSEQSVIIQNYATVYEGALDNLEVMKDLYLSMILSMTFALVFAVVLPILTGTDPTLTVAAVIVLFIFVQFGFFLAIRNMAPHDPVWYQAEEIAPDGERKAQVTLVASAVLSLALIGIIAGGLFGVLPFTLADLIPLVDSIPREFYLAIPLTPFVIPGLVVRAEESRIKSRDGEFPSFIRALGASESAKQSTTSTVLEDLRTKDFGALTPEIDDLYKRLNMRIEPTQAWRYFAADSQSYLIQKFSEMYLIGRQMGGDPKQLGEIISENMNQVLQLRERRRQATITLIGLLYGITAASTFAFFIGLEVVNILSEMSLSLNSSEFDFGSLIHTDVYDIPLIEFLLFLVILFNALLSSLMIRTVDGGHKVNSYLHFVALTWLGYVIALFTQAVVGVFLSV